MNYLLLVATFFAGYFFGCAVESRLERRSRRDNVVRIDAARRYELAKGGEL